MKSLAPNTMIQNRYLIVHLIGKGGMGEVYLAVDQRLGSAVALKRTFFADDEMLGNAFEREARILARLRHPVLPKVSDHFAENGEQYLVMEHIAGEDLSKRLETAQKSFPTSWVLFWADQLLDALSYLHSHEPPIIHRDIKPQNLKLTDENHIILLDFGLSKNSTGMTNVTSGGSSGSVVGYTPHYAPMEQIRGTGTSPKSDIYALSATLYQLLTNAVPADALSRADSLLNGMEDPIKPLSDLNPEISPEVSGVILHGMEVSQDKRFANARDMQKALRKAFTTMQDAMSAHTVAFNAQSDIPGTPINTYSAAPPTEVFEHSRSTGSAATSSPPAAASSLGSSGGSFPTGNTGGSGGFSSGGASTSGDEYGVKQSDVKTEVYRAGDSTPTPFAEDYGSSAQSYGESNFSPDATVPIISFGAPDASGQQGTPSSTPEFFTTPNIDTSEASTADEGFFTTPNIDAGSSPFSNVSEGEFGSGIDPNATAVGHFVEEEQPRQEEHYVAPAPVKKKGSSKTLLLVGGLAALFILGIGAAGAGWFVYANYYSGALVDPTPSPEPSLEATPSPEPTIESIFDSNTNSSNLNSNSNSNENSNLTVAPTPMPTEVPAQTPTGPSSTPRPTPEKQVRITPSHPSNTQKPTPKPRPNSNRGDILQ